MLAPDALSAITTSVDLTLPCGRYYLDEITPLGAEVSIALTGRTALFVAGNLNPTNTFAITLGPEAELDLFVAGDLTIANNFAIGDKERAAKTRVYVGGKGTFTSPTEFAGNLYLPNHTLQVQNQLEVWGSLFVGGLNIVSPLTVHYDEAILLIDGCPDPNSQCEDCHDCINPKPACIDGWCAACSSDDDCCPPLKCLPDGHCKLEEPT